MGSFQNIVTLLGLLLLAQKTYGAISFASYYANSMVLQSEPVRAVIWGYGDDLNEGQQVVVTVDNKQYTTTIRADLIPNRTTWNVTIDPKAAGGPYVIRVTTQADEIEISDVMFGDVWVCSGQSNMVHTVANSDDAVNEIGNAANFQNVRLFRVGLDTSYDPLNDLAEVQLQWTRPNEDNVPSYSAVCWLFGRRLTTKLNKPIGLIQTAWGGTRIEAWSSPDSLAQCSSDKTKTQIPRRAKRQVNPNEESVLWNAMIHPLLTMTIKGAIWYQGESNRADPERYNCSFPAMINDWRKNFNAKSGQTDVNFPFGFVQLAPNRNDPSVDDGFPDLRWAQTASKGYVPNNVMQNVFMAVAMDLPDFDGDTGTIHPRYKQDIGKRLSISGLTVAYGQNMGRWYGPRPTSFTKIANNEIQIMFENGSAKLDFRNGDGYEICCSSSGQGTCDENSGSTWVITTARLDGTSNVILDGSLCSGTAQPDVTGMRYAWRESPCLLRQCSVYSTAEENEMPTPPYYYEGNFS